jgi:hypothetical protein
MRPPRLIPSSELTERDLPGPDGDIVAIYRFALTFDIYKYTQTLPAINAGSSNDTFSRLARLAKPASLEFERDGSLPGTIDDLRACLSFEAMRYRHMGTSAGGYNEARWVPYLRGLVEAIRERLRDGQTA